MEKKIMLTVLVLVLSTVLPYFAAHKIGGSSPPEATIWVEPTTPGLKMFICETFEINITVTDARNLSDFDIDLTYGSDTPKNTIEVVETENEDIFRFCKLLEPSEIDKTLFEHYPVEKRIQVSSHKADTNPVTGHVVLATIKFRCIRIGAAYLMFPTNRTELRDSSGEIRHETKDSWYTIVERRDERKEVDQNFVLCTDILDFSGQYLFDIKADNVVLDLNGHTIHNSAEVGHAVEVQEKNNVTIKNGVIKDWQYGIVISRCSHINIINIEFVGFDFEAILIENSSNVTICNNNMSHSRKECLRLRNCTDVEVGYNVFSNNNEYGIVMEWNSKNNIIRNNTIEDNLILKGDVYT